MYEEPLLDRFIKVVWDLGYLDGTCEDADFDCCVIGLGVWGMDYDSCMKVKAALETLRGKGYRPGMDIHGMIDGVEPWVMSVIIGAASTMDSSESPVEHDITGEYGSISCSVPVDTIPAHLEIPGWVVCGSNIERMSILDFMSFCGCERLEKVVLPCSVKQVSTDAFYDCPSFRRFIVNPHNPYIRSDEQGMLYDREMTELLVCPMGIESLEIPACVRTIGECALENCDNLRTITVDPGNPHIGTDDCGALTDKVTGERLPIAYSPSTRRHLGIDG